MRIDAVKELLETHLPHVYRFALYLLRDHHLAQDIAQEAMLRAWGRRRKLREVRAARGWLLRITANLCRDYQRRARHLVSRAQPIVLEPRAAGVEPLDGLVQREQQQLVRELLETLSPRERTVLYLSAFEQLAQAEIAAVLGLNPGAVKVALSRARKTMRGKLAEIEAGRSELAWRTLPASARPTPQ
jgi:RNA polymerase sigma-70 factor (ECF subfamily)